MRNKEGRLCWWLLGAISEVERLCQAFGRPVVLLPVRFAESHELFGVCGRAVHVGGLPEKHLLEPFRGAEAPKRRKWGALLIVSAVILAVLECPRPSKPEIVNEEALRLLTALTWHARRWLKSKSEAI